MLTVNDMTSDLDPHPFIIRNSRTGHFLPLTAGLLLLSVLTYLKLTSDSISDLPFWILVPISIAIILNSLRQIIRPTKIMQIDREGIWTIRHKLTPWENILSFSTRDVSSRPAIRTVIFSMQTTDKEITVDISFSNVQNDRTIRRYIDLYKGNHEIQDLGSENYA